MGWYVVCTWKLILFFGYLLLVVIPLQLLVKNFVAETEKEIFKAVLEGNLDLKSLPWPSISEGAKDLIRKMLARDPKKRITATQALGKNINLL